jgi:hypothetical protein
LRTPRQTPRTPRTPRQRGTYLKGFGPLNGVQFKIALGEISMLHRVSARAAENPPPHIAFSDCFEAYNLIASVINPLEVEQPLLNQIATLLNIPAEVVKREISRAGLLGLPTPVLAAQLCVHAVNDAVARVNERIERLLPHKKSGPASLTIADFPPLAKDASFGGFCGFLGAESLAHWGIPLMIPGEVCLRQDVQDAYSAVFGEAGLVHFLGCGARSPSQIERFIEIIRQGDEGVRRLFGDNKGALMLRIVQTSVFSSLTRSSAFSLAELSAATIPFPANLFLDCKVRQEEEEEEIFSEEEEEEDGQVRSDPNARRKPNADPSKYERGVHERVAQHPDRTSAMLKAKVKPRFHPKWHSARSPPAAPPGKIPTQDQDGYHWKSQLNLFQDGLQGVLESLRGELTVATTHSDETVTGGAPVLELWEECSAGKVDVAELQEFLHRMGYWRWGPLTATGITALARHIMDINNGGVAVGGDSEEHVLFLPGLHEEFRKRCAALRIMFGLSPHRKKPQWMQSKLENRTWQPLSDLAQSKISKHVWATPVHVQPKLAYGRRHEPAHAGADRMFTPTTVKPLSKAEVAQTDNMRMMLATSAIADTNSKLFSSAVKAEHAQELFQEHQVKELETLEKEAELMRERGEWSAIHVDGHTAQPLQVHQFGDRLQVVGERIADQYPGLQSRPAFGRVGPATLRGLNAFRAHFRGYMTRKLLSAQQAEHIAASRIQLAWYTHAYHRKHAATRIQGWYRALLFGEILMGLRQAKERMFEMDGPISGARSAAAARKQSMALKLSARGTGRRAKSRSRSRSISPGPSPSGAWQGNFRLE